MQRPQFVTIIAVLAAIGGVFGILGAFALFGLGAVGGALAAQAGVDLGFLVGGFAIFWGLVTLIVSAADLLFAYGAWYLKPWGWLLGIGIQGANILIALVNLLGKSSDFFSFLISVAISGAIIYMLNTPDIKRAFGRV
jgi:hypothetical protein